jgi:tRNA-dihydrouridine synthase
MLDVLKHVCNRDRHHPPLFDDETPTKKGARSGHYGAFLMDEPEIVLDIVRKCSRHLRIPVLVKTRIFPQFKDTLRFATDIADAGTSSFVFRCSCWDEWRAIYEWRAISHMYWFRR